MLAKLQYRIILSLLMLISLSGCSTIRSVGDALANTIKGFTIHFPTIRFP